ncbi:transcriptional regulator [Brachybacterium vulturis]|uniref:Transcriptional regulator n=1 Tax=Brachybacterium vulturis TaxID=2017484 RepID=A0A291GLJ6_9MICO|nr:metalloregulator ArsR/SmtB family transcription factor [Brachybacterium vulturis]ATG50932.1 transcriptional regulator [Brachybacterium vulturis]
MHALDVLGDPVRRRILELLADHGELGAPELGAGEIGEIVQPEFGISQPAVSQHLRVLREHGFATVRAEGRRRFYAVDSRGPQEAQEWLTPFERFWLPKLDALGTELARGKLQRRRAVDAASPAVADPASPAVPGTVRSVASGAGPPAAAETARAPSNSAPGTPPAPTPTPTPKET